MNTIKDAVKAHEEIEAQAKAKAVAEIRYVKAMKIGEVGRQGDIYIHRVKDAHAHGEARKSHQLAIGDTMGSRHIAKGKIKLYEGTTRPDWCGERTFLGPLILAEERFTVTHPEHAHFCLPAGTYQVTHQMDARTMERTRD